MVTLCPFFIIHRLQDHRSGSPFPGRVNYAQPPCDVARRVLVTCVAGVPVRSLQNRRFCWVTDKFIRLSQPPFWFVRTVGIGTTPLSPIRFSPTPWVALWYSSQAFSIPQPRRPRDSSACSLIHFRGEGAGLIWSDHPPPPPRAFPRPVLLQNEYCLKRTGRLVTAGKASMPETQMEVLTLSLSRVINIKFPLQSPEILHHTVWRTSLFILTQMKDGYTTISTTSSCISP